MIADRSWRPNKALKLTKLAKELDDGKYAYSWYENAEAEPASVDGDATGAGLTSHF